MDDANLWLAMKLPTSHPRRRGSVLIVVLWASLGLVSLTLLFGHSMTMTYRGADNDLAGRQAQQAIDGAARYVMTLLANNTTPGLLPVPQEFLNDSIPVGEATFYLIGRSDTARDGAVCHFGLVDESGKLSLNVDPTLDAGQKQQALSALATALRNLPGITDAFVDAVIDWQDADDEPGSNGAESETYLRFAQPYACKNEPFESLEELALLNGATREILYGEDTNLNGILDANENDGSESDPPDNADGKLDTGILEHVTVFSRESNLQSDGTTARVNVANLQQSGQTLATLIDQKLGAGRGQRVVQAATGGPLRSPLELFIRCRVAGALSEEEFAQIAYDVTVKDGQYLYGLVNVNTASEAVLATLPGMDAGKAASLVAARLSRGQTDTSYTWIIDVLTEPVAVALGPFITGRSSQVTADIAAVGRHGRGYRRERIVIDQSTGTPRIVYRRSLAPLGWALGTEIRQELAQRTEGAR